MSTMFNDFIIFENYFRLHPRLENALCIACFFAIAVQHCSTFLFHSQSGRNYSTDLLFLYSNSSKFYKRKTKHPNIDYNINKKTQKDSFDTFLFILNILQHHSIHFTISKAVYT